MGNKICSVSMKTGNQESLNLEQREEKGTRGLFSLLLFLTQKSSYFCLIWKPAQGPDMPCLCQVSLLKGETRQGNQHNSG